jgi:hypothetical protein
MDVLMPENCRVKTATLFIKSEITTWVDHKKLLARKKEKRKSVKNARTNKSVKKSASRTI